MVDNKIEKEHEHKESVSQVNETKPNIDYWKVSAVVLGALCLVLLFFAFKGGTTGKAVSTTEIGTKAVEYINAQILQGQGTVTLDKVTEKGGLYEVSVNFNGKPVPAYFTKDGEYFLGTQMISLTEDLTSPSASPTPKEVPKSDKPKVEAFIFSYCPYGLQFEKALIPVYRILKDVADINIVAIGAMHGEYEKIESFRQLCIQKNYGKDKLFDYLELFNTDTKIGACNGDAACLKPLLTPLMGKLSIDEAKINSCMETDAQALYDKDVARAQELGQSGSPGFVINGVDVQVNRSPDAIKEAICAAYNNAPSACTKTVPSTTASAGFGASSSTTPSTSASC